MTLHRRASKLQSTVVHLKPDTESRLREPATATGRVPEELVEEAMAGYLTEFAQIRTTLDRRYDEIKDGRVKPVSGEEALTRLLKKSGENPKLVFQSRSEA